MDTSEIKKTLVGVCGFGVDLYRVVGEEIEESGGPLLYAKAVLHEVRHEFTCNEFLLLPAYVAVFLGPYYWAQSLKFCVKSSSEDL